jgi:hypothetical protein
VVDFELVIEEEEDDGKGGGLGGSYPSSLLSFFDDSPWKGLFVSSNPHIIPLPSQTWRIKSFSTLSHSETFLLPMPSPHFEKSSFLMQSQDPLIQSRLHHE